MNPRSIQCGMVTDNTATNKNMWVLLSAAYMDKYFYGCASHSLHHIVQKLFAPTRRRNGSYGNLNGLEYQFVSLMEFTNKGIIII